VTGAWLACALQIPAAVDEVPPRPGPAQRTDRSPAREAEARAKDGRDKDRGAAASRQERERWRQELRNLPPAEREARLKELRQNYGFSAPAWDERSAWRDEWEKLSPQERQARLQAWREQRQVPFTPEEREARRQQLRERLARQIAELRHKATNGTLSVEGTNRLDRLEQVLQRFGPGGDSPDSKDFTPKINKPKPPPEKVKAL
jgi:hypothetical protein